MADRLLGKVFGDFRIERMVGRGNIGKVYRGTQVSLARPVAIKVLENGLFTLEELKTRFMREARFIAGLEHPNIIPIYAAGQEEAFYYYVMRLMNGRTLQEEIAGGLSLAASLSCLADVAGALGYAHDRGLIHRDVKPANIMIADGTAMLTDFGLARLVDSSTITSAERFLGTPLYFAPEQARRERATFKSDLYALGLILYEIAAGRPAFDPDSDYERLIHDIAHGVFERPSRARPVLPAKVEEILHRALRLDPAERYPSAHDMREDLLAAASNGAYRPSPRPARRRAAPEPGFPALPPGEPASVPRPARFGGYLLREVIGNGAAGIVYRAEETETGRSVAVKALPQSGALDRHVVARFLREGTIGARLRHPNIVAIHEMGQVQGMHYFAMELVEGGSLKKRIEQGPLPVRAALEMVRDAARAAHYAHTRGVVHRDLKPANILVDPSGRVVLTDFGLARENDASSSTNGEPAGTPAYMPPEQVRCGPADARSDVYALGATLFHLLTGHAPFEAETPEQAALAVLGDDPPDPRSLRPEIPPPAREALLRAMRKIPGERWSTAEAFADALDAALGAL